MIMKNRSSWITWVALVLPFAYLAWIWSRLPRQVPLHWNWKGEVDRYGSKYELILIPLLMPVLIWAIFRIVPLIDPKGRAAQSGGKYWALGNLMTWFMSILALYILYTAAHPGAFRLEFLLCLTGLLFALFGNYAPTLRPNYFIGIRTPWTLENPDVWRSTHRMAGKWWMTGGLLLVAICPFLSRRLYLILWIMIMASLVLVPVIYSYVQFKKVQKKEAI